METRIQDVMSIYLKQFGFDAMASEVLKETDEDRIRIYARVIRKQADKVDTRLAHKLSTLLHRAGY